MKTTPYTLENKTLRLNSAPRCLAKTRKGSLCQAPSVHGKRRCRLHGCGNGSGAPKGNTYAVTHGGTTTKVKAFKKEIREEIRDSFALMEQIS